MKLLAKLLIISWLLAGFATHAQTIIADTFNVSGTSSGFALGAGVNSGINPPATRLTGSAKANLRYIQTGTKADTAYTIRNNQLPGHGRSFSASGQRKSGDAFLDQRRAVLSAGAAVNPGKRV